MHLIQRGGRRRRRLPGQSLHDGRCAVKEDEFKGYTVAYGRDETQFPVYLFGVLSAIMLAAGLYTLHTIWFALGFAFAGFAFYNFPLLETGRPVVGANEYGIFIQGFGIIRWSAVGNVELVPIAVRILTIHELQIALKSPLGKALISDWRRASWWRQLMRLPWSMTHQNVIRINLEPFDQPPEEVHRTIVRMWKHYRS